MVSTPAANAANAANATLTPQQQQQAGGAPNAKRKPDGADDTLLLLMSDPYANFVVQRAFDASAGALRQQLVEEIKSRSDVLSKFTYGRHALLHLSKSLGERAERGMGGGPQGDHRGGKNAGQAGQNNNQTKGANQRYRKK